MTKTTRAAELLLEYKNYCESRVIELRKEACDWAQKARDIAKLIPAEQIQEVEEQKEADEHWSLSNNGLIDLLNKKVVNEKK